MSNQLRVLGFALSSIPLLACGSVEPTTIEPGAGVGGAAGSMPTGGASGAGMGGTDPTGGSSGTSGTGGTAPPLKPARAINITPARFFPEGVAVDAAGNFYIGSMDQGDIYKAVADGAVAGIDAEAAPFIAAGTNGMVSVLGLYADDATSTLWVCSSDAGNGALKTTAPVALKAFDLATGTPKGSWAWPAPTANPPLDATMNPSAVNGFCNDITIDAEGNLYATDSWYPRILRLPAGATEAMPLEEWLNSPVFPATQWHLNGIDVDQSTNTIYVVENHPGDLYRVPIEADGMPGAVTKITTTPRALGGPDGLKVIAPNLLATAETHADLRGGVSIIDVTGDTATVTEVLGGLDGYATVALHQASVWVVENQGQHFWGPADNGPDATPPFRIVEIPITVGAGAGTIPITPARFFPEGVTVDAAGSFYVGSMEEGSIRKSTGSGVEAAEFIAAGSNGLVSVLGLLATDDALWACSSDASNSPRMGMAPVALKKFNLADGMPAGSWDWPAYATPATDAPPTVNGFCNDIATDPDGEFLYATDSWYPRILRLPTDAAATDMIEEWLVDPTFGADQWHLNGINVDPMGQNLYVVENHPGHLWRVAIAANGDAGMVTEIITSRPIRGPDGLKVIDMNTLAVAEGSGMAIVELMGSTGNVRTISTGLDGIATFAMLNGSAWLVENQADHFWGAMNLNGPTPTKPFRLVEVPLGL